MGTLTLTVTILAPIILYVHAVDALTFPVPLYCDNYQ